jgi:hypothetical protein
VVEDLSELTRSDVRLGLLECLRVRYAEKAYGYQPFSVFAGATLPAHATARGKGKLSRTVRFWRLHLRTSRKSADLARMINPVVRGWMNYYGCFYRSALYPLLDRINTYLLRWIQKKYRTGMKQALRRLADGHARRPTYFDHWTWVTPAGRGPERQEPYDGTSRTVPSEPGVRSPRATRLPRLVVLRRSVESEG